ncbi:hypothetical protein BGZ94_008983 [Podila epigama]|nr:hypothetical protein BGZ94_008983 [Podila epigama]
MQEASRDVQGIKAWVSRPPSPQSSSSSSSPPSISPLSLPLLHYQTNDSREVLYTKDEEEANKWIKDIKSNLVAFDVEWRPYVYQKGQKKAVQGKVSLIQLGDDRTLYLFHVFHMKAFPKELSRILQDSRILKVGVNIQNDARKLFKDWGICCSSLVELGALCRQVVDGLINPGRSVRSMDSLARDLLGHAVEKTPLTRMGNWEVKNLSSAQISYAANDVFVTYEIGQRIKLLQQTRPFQEYTVQLATLDANGSTVLLVRGTLQEREDYGVREQDIIESRTSSKATLPTKQVIINEEPTKTVGVKGVSQPLSVIESGRLGGMESSPSSSTTRPKSRIVTVPTSSSSSQPLSSQSSKSSTSFSAPSSVYGWSGSSNKSIRTFRPNRQTVITVIPPEYQKRRSLSSKAGRPDHCSDENAHDNGGNKDNDSTNDIDDRDAALVSSDLDSMEVLEGLMKGDDGREAVSWPRGLLPMSLEGKDVVARNQAVWVEAGGRDVTQDEEDEEDDGGDDWYLNQNQAFYASLSSAKDKGH